jgi:hypothetical protein
MPVPLNRSEYTKIYDRYTKPSKPLTEGNIGDTSQDLPQANPQQQSGQQPPIKNQQPPQQPVEDTQHMKDFTDTLTKLQEVISKFKDPTTVQNAAKAIQMMLSKNPKQASTPVGTSQYLPANAQQSPSDKSNNNIPGSAK